jgi:PAS domain S-box-containing protein
MCWSLFYGVLGEGGDLMKLHSLPFKINVTILITTISISVLFGAILYPLEINRNNKEKNRVTLLLDTVFRQKKNDLANEIFANQQRAQKASLKEIESLLQEIVHVCLYRENGEKGLCSNTMLFDTIPSEKFINIDNGPLFEKISIQGRSLGVYINSIEVIGNKIGYLAIYYDFTRIEQDAKMLFYVFIALLLATTSLIGVILNIFLFHSVIRPVSLLRDAMRRVEEGHIGETVTLARRDEIGEMGDAFNDMSQQLLKSKQKLGKTEEKYRDIFEHSIEGIFQSSPDQHRFLTANPSLAHILGFDTPEKLVSSVSSIKDQLFVFPTDWENLMDSMKKSGRVVGFETQLLRPGLDAVWVSISVRQVCNAKDELLFYEGSIIDITERRQKEKAERERKTAEAANKAKSEFLAMMSHEIRTPLNAILGFTEILEAEIDNNKHRNYLRTIKMSGTSLLQLINDILDLSKIEEGKMDILPIEVDIRSLLLQLQELFSVRIAGKDIEFRLNISQDVPSLLMLDLARLRQILFNLIGNAVKFTDQGCIEISVEVTDSSEIGKKDLTLRVRDTGIGISPEAGREIFQSFTQIKDTTRPFTEGTGLGLTISKNLVEMMGGKIELASQKGKGSTFRVDIPGVPIVQTQGLRDKKEIFSKDSGRIALGPAVVLIADDLEINRHLVKAALVGNPITLLEAEDGPAAVTLAVEHTPDLILMDIRMPGLDGYQVLNEIRKVKALDATPVIALTASGMKEDIASIRKAGFNDYLIRPFSIQQFKDKVAGYLLEGLKGKKNIIKEQPIVTRSETAPYLAVWTCPEAILGRLMEMEKNEWGTLKRQQRIPDIRSFAQTLMEMGKKHNAEVLRLYGQILTEYADVFDIDKMQETLNDFPRICMNIQQ